MLTPRNDRDDILFATVSRLRGMRYHLLAERLPEGGWDWTTWRAGDNPNSAQHGRALTAKAAMAAAGGAVRYFDAGQAGGSGGIPAGFPGHRVALPSWTIFQETGWGSGKASDP
jgi:hypothetical protein